MKIQNKTTALFILFLASFLIFFGRSMQLILWDAPFRELIWDERLMKPIVQGVFGRSWQEYATDLSIDIKVQRTIKAIGWIILSGAVSTVLLYFSKKRIFRIPIYIASVFVTLIVFLEFKEKFFHSAQMIEGTIQALAPICFIWLLNPKIKIKYIQFFLKIIIGLTFLGHGLYAVGVYATPGNFVDMTIILLGVNEEQAKLFLHIVGWLDIIIFPLLFIPKTIKPALWYAIIWGVLTALARIFYYLELTNFELNSFFMVHDTLFRLAHGLVPLALYFYLNHQKKLYYEKN